MKRTAAPIAAVLLASSGVMAAGDLPRPASCPPEMALVRERAVCIDRFEASLSKGSAGNESGRGVTAKAQSKRGALPAVQVSQLQAGAACANAGKRLCRRDEWVAACRGPDGTRDYPYGAKYEPGRCNDRALGERRKPRVAGPAPAGSLAACCTPEGVCDLSGNVWEWLADAGPGGNPVDLVGGGFGNNDDSRNLACVPKHPLAQPATQRGEAMGFRCCRDLGERSGSDAGRGNLAPVKAGAR